MHLRANVVPERQELFVADISELGHPVRQKCPALHNTLEGIRLEWNRGCTQIGGGATRDRSDTVTSHAVNAEKRSARGHQGWIRLQFVTDERLGAGAGGSFACPSSAKVITRVSGSRGNANRSRLSRAALPKPSR